MMKGWLLEAVGRVESERCDCSVDDRMRVSCARQPGNLKKVKTHEERTGMLISIFGTCERRIFILQGTNGNIYRFIAVQLQIIEPEKLGEREREICFCSRFSQYKPKSVISIIQLAQVWEKTVRRPEAVRIEVLGTRK